MPTSLHGPVSLMRIVVAHCQSNEDNDKLASQTWSTINVSYDLLQVSDLASPQGLPTVAMMAVELLTIV